MPTASSPHWKTAFLIACATSVAGVAIGGVRSLHRQTPDIKFATSDPAVRAHSVRLSQVSRYEPISIEIPPRFEGSDVQQLHEIVRTICEYELVVGAPLERLAQFAWCYRPGLTLNGFFAEIDDVTPLGAGFQVRLKVRPRVSSVGSCVAYTPDYRLETYWVNPGGAILVESEAPADSLEGIAFSD